jgi:hypothetical protein
MRRLAILALVLAAGCTAMEWQKQDASAEQLRADEQECRQHAAREASFRAWHYQAMLEPVFSRDSSGRGFFVGPSSAMVDPYGHQMVAENRLTQSCMESRGYTLVPVSKK